MRLTGLLAATAIVSMIAAPAFAASANPAARLSLTQSSENAGSSTKMAGKAAQPSLLVPGLAIAAVIVAAVAASHSDNKAASS